jgi:uncharacterized FAD-dependent dehydrogenase
MAKTLYVGFRVEIYNRFMTNKNWIKQYNSTHKKTQIFDLHKEGVISIEKNRNMLIARGNELEKGKSNMANFSLMVKVGTKKEKVERVVQIINVLGNDRLIKERIATFVRGESMLNHLPELSELRKALQELDKIIPGLVKSGWYYAPEARLE